MTGYWKKYFIIQLIAIIILSIVGLPKDNISLYIWLGVIGIDSIIVHPVFYEVKEK
jgi:hypothetical protein